MVSVKQLKQRIERHRRSADKLTKSDRRCVVWTPVGAAVMLLGLALSACGQQARTTATSRIDEGMKGRAMKDNLVLSLTFDDRDLDPSRFRDASGCNNHAVPAADSQITSDGGGREGEALEKWATVPGDGLNLTEWVRVECWVKPSRDMGDREHVWHGIVSKGISAASDVYGLRFKGHTGSLQFVIRDQGKPYVAQAKRQWKANTWYHLKGEYDGQTVRLYENDVLLAETPHRGRIDTTTLPLSINSGWGRNYQFSGIIDSLRIWGVAGEPDAGGRTPKDGRIRLDPHESERSVTIQHPAFPGVVFKREVPETVGNDQSIVYTHTDWSPVNWKGPDNDGVIGYRGENEQVVFAVKMIPGADSIEVHHSVTNKTAAPWQHVYSFPCLSAAGTPPFQDFGMQRTFLPIAGKGLLTGRQVFGKGAVRGMCRLVDPSFGKHAFIDIQAAGPPPAILTPLEAEYPYEFIASEDGKWLVAVAAEKAAFFFNNAYGSCIHTCPYFGEIKPGETKSVLSRIYFLQGDPETLAETLHERYRRDFLQAK